MLLRNFKFMSLTAASLLLCNEHNPYAKQKYIKHTYIRYCFSNNNDK